MNTSNRIGIVPRSYSKRIALRCYAKDKITTNHVTIYTDMPDKEFYDMIKEKLEMKYVTSSLVKPLNVSIKIGSCDMIKVYLPFQYLDEATNWFKDILKSMEAK